MVLRKEISVYLNMLVNRSVGAVLIVTLKVRKVRCSEIEETLGNGYTVREELEYQLTA